MLELATDCDQNYKYLMKILTPCIQIPTKEEQVRVLHSSSQLMFLSREIPTSCPVWRDSYDPKNDFLFLLLEQDSHLSKI